MDSETEVESKRVKLHDKKWSLGNDNLKLDVAKHFESKPVNIKIHYVDSRPDANGEERVCLMTEEYGVLGVSQLDDCLEAIAAPKAGKWFCYEVIVWNANDRIVIYNDYELYCKFFTCKVPYVVDIYPFLKSAIPDTHPMIFCQLSIPKEKCHWPLLSEEQRAEMITLLQTKATELGRKKVFYSYW